MKPITSAALATLALLLVACTSKSSPEPAKTASEAGTPAVETPAVETPAVETPAVETPAVETPAVEALSPEALLTKMRADIATLEAKPEHQAPQVKVQHLLVSFKGAPRMRNVERSKEEAEALTAEIWQEIQAGEDFDGLVKKYTNDSHPGIYPMTLPGRGQMVAGFGNVGWRLEVGEFGIAPWNATASPYGWHIIKRLE